MNIIYIDKMEGMAPGGRTPGMVRQPYGRILQRLVCRTFCRDGPW